MAIQLQNISKNFGAYPAVKHVDLRIAPGEFVAFLGPSGSGKTTLLRLIAGLEYPDEGAILLHGENMAHISARKRGVGFVFQHYALFRHMTVLENISFGLKIRGWRNRPRRSEIRARAERLLSLVQLEGHGKRFPAQLSGGQRQRVALARALAVEPRILLLDEPFGALDAQVRKDLRRWLRALHDDMKLTSIFVTHDQEEAVELADRVVLLRAGRIEQIGTPQMLYDYPASPFVMEFMGRANRFYGAVITNQLQIAQQKIDCTTIEGKREESSVIYVRPHDFTIGLEPNDGWLEAQISLAVPLATSIRLECRIQMNGAYIEVEIPRRNAEDLNLKASQKLWLRPEKAFVFPG